MRRRKFIALLAGAAATRPFAAHAQQVQRMPRIGVLMNRAASDPEGQARVTAFKEGMQRGWRDGRNVQIDTCWGADDVEVQRERAQELFRGCESKWFNVGAAEEKKSGSCKKPSCRWFSE